MYSDPREDGRMDGIVGLASSSKGLSFSASRASQQRLLSRWSAARGGTTSTSSETVKEENDPRTPKPQQDCRPKNSSTVFCAVQSRVTTSLSICLPKKSVNDGTTLHSTVRASERAHIAQGHANIWWTNVSTGLGETRKTCRRWGGNSRSRS